MHIHTTLRPSDISRSKKLSYILNALKNCLSYRSTLVIGDSNTHPINQREVDAEGRSVAIRSISGLCVVAAAHALKAYKFTYRKVKKLVWSIGINDFLHENQHCTEEWDMHLKSLYTESARIFPNASISLVLPFHGLSSVPSSFTKEFEKKVKALCPKIKRLRTPSMLNKVKHDGVHLNREGVDKYFSFLQAQFTKVRSTREDNTPSNAHNSSASSARVQSGESFRVNSSDFPPIQQAHTAVPPAPPYVLQSQPPYYPAHQVQMIRELTEAVTHAMLRRCGPPFPPHPYSNMNFTTS